MNPCRDLKMINEFYGITKDGELYSVKPTLRKLSGVISNGIKRYSLTKPTKMTIYAHLETRRLWNIDILKPQLPPNCRKVNDRHWLDLDTGRLWALSSNSNHILKEVPLKHKKNGDVIYRWQMKTYVLDTSDVKNKTNIRTNKNTVYEKINRNGVFKCKLGNVNHFSYWEQKALRDYREIGIDLPDNWLERSFKVWQLEEILIK